MAMIRPYPIGGGDLRPLPTPGGAPSGGRIGADTLPPVSQPVRSVSEDGRPRDLMVAGAQLERASDSMARIALEEMAIANNTAVEEKITGYISAKQAALYGEGGFMTQRGEAALTGAAAVSKGLLDRKKQIVDEAPNAYQRQALSRRLDSHFLEASGDISRHVSTQALQWQKDVLDARSIVLARDAVQKADDPEALDGRLRASESVGLERARILHGAPPDSEVAQVYAAQEASKTLKQVLQARLDSGQKRSALSMYDRYKDRLGLKDDHALTMAMRGVADEVRGEQIANDAVAKVGLPPIRSGDNQSGNLTQRRNDTIERLQSAGFSENVAKGIAANFEHESGFRPGAVNPRDGADGSDSIGLGQWNGPRAKAFLQFAKNKGMSPADPNTGIAYMRAEMQGEVPYSVSGISPTLKDRLEATKFPGEAAALLSREYFKPRASTEASSRAETATSYATPGTVYKGDLKAGYEQAAFDISNRSDLTREERASALAILNKTQTAVTSYQAAAVKSLRDQANATLATAFVDPSALKAGTLASFATRAEQLGEGELAVRYHLLASMEGIIKNGLTSAPAEQVKLLKEISEGLPKQLLEGIQSGSSELVTRGNDLFAKLKKAQADGLDVSGLTKLATDAAQAFASAGKGEKAREVQQFVAAAVTSGQALKLPPIEQERVLRDLERTTSEGAGTEQQLELYHLLKRGFEHQNGEFQKDALATGSKLYGMPLPPLALGDQNALAQRAGIARRINAARPGADAIPLTQPEVQSFRDMLAKGTPESNVKLFQSLGSLPDDMQIGVAAALAGKGKADPLSQMYAAALAKFTSRDPTSQQAAIEILGGAEILKNAGDSRAKIAPSNEDFQRALQQKLGGALELFGQTPVSSVITEAVKASYAYRANRSGKQNEKLDVDLLSQSIDAVTGGTISYRGKTIFAPRAGATAYDVDAAMSTLRDSDLPDGLRTTEGDPITADKVRQHARLTSAGEGAYVVRIPDPRAAMELRPVVDPRTGRPWVLYLDPLLDRRAAAPEPLDNSAAAARRRAPISPTEGLTP